jgi:hypothetical protein
VTRDLAALDIAHSKVISLPEKKPHPLIVEREKYAWTFRLSNVVLYLDTPIVITADLRSSLDAFRGRDPNNPWAWFVQATHKLTEHDFNVLVRSQA